VDLTLDDVGLPDDDEVEDLDAEIVAGTGFEVLHHGNQVVRGDFRDLDVRALIAFDDLDAVEDRHDRGGVLPAADHARVHDRVVLAAGYEAGRRLAREGDGPRGEAEA